MNDNLRLQHFFHTRINLCKNLQFSKAKTVQYINTVQIIIIFWNVLDIESNNNSFFSPFISGWSLHGLHCYQFFNFKHSWNKASELCKRYGSDLATVKSYRQNNFTAQLASGFLTGQTDNSYWLGLQAHNELQTNMLSTDSGDRISQYYGHWATGHPNVDSGKCVQAVIKVSVLVYIFFITLV